MKYIILSVADANTLADLLALRQPSEGSYVATLVDRLRDDTGGDLEEIAADLKKLDYCRACVVEAQTRYCESLVAQRIGRRLSRLLARAYNEYRAELGTTIERAAALVVIHVQKTGMPVMFVHNDFRVPVRLDTKVIDILSQWKAFVKETP